MDWIEGAISLLTGLSLTLGILVFAVKRQQKVLDKCEADIVDLKIRLARLEEKIRKGGNRHDKDFN